MQKEIIKKSLSWASVLLCMAVIFWLSSRTADQSSSQSGAILLWLKEHFGDNLFTDFIVRKAAHFLEFTGLSLLINNAFYQTLKSHKYVLSAGLTSVYAATDEIHQLFVAGRSCQISDWGIDTMGALLGTLIFAVILLTVNGIKRKITVDSGEN